MNTKKTLQALVLLAACASTQGLLAQTAPATSAARPSAAQEDVLVLSPFEVTADTDNGYAATETLAGTRIRTDLRDVGSAISVITKEFLQDIGATDTNTLLQYTTNAEATGTRGTFAGLGNATSVDESTSLRAPSGAQRVRGLAAADTTRDFFVTDIPWDSYNVDRIDIQRGPNSILFGLGSPAGIVNASLKSAEFRNKNSVEFRFGSYGSMRGSLDVNRVLIDKVLAIRVGGLWDHEKFRQHPAYENDERGYVAVNFSPKLFKDPSFRTNLKVKYENGKIDANRPRTVTPGDAITPWFKPVGPTTLNQWTLDNGMGKLAVQDGYLLGSGSSTSAFGNPYLSAAANQQQPLWFLDGQTGGLQRVYGGFIGGGRSSTGAVLGNAVTLPGRAYSEVFYRVNTLDQVALTLQLPGYQSGQYRVQSLTDPTVFDYYNTLIDGPNKKEFENWDAYNVSLSQTGWGDRVGIELNYDRQKYKRGGQALLGGQPSITIDVMKNFQDYYLTGPAATTNNNPNFGRPYVSTTGGSGNSYESDRKYYRASVFGEIRASDFVKSDFLIKLLGKHRFNGVYSKENYFAETKAWVMNANNQAWAGYWNGNSGSGSGITDRPPTGIIYLGGSVAANATASGSNIPGINSEIQYDDTNIYLFDPTWQNFSVGYGDPWTPSAALATSIFTGTGLTQASNPANYVGWNSSRVINLLRNNLGDNDDLNTRQAKGLRVTKSYAGSWQGFFWNNAVVTTLGWRFDSVSSGSVNGYNIGGNRGIINQSATGNFSYTIPTDFVVDPNKVHTNQGYAVSKDHSVAGGVVVHINRLFEKDPLPINISLSYNKSSNFQVTDARRDIYGTVIGNPSGETKDYGILLSTKDGKYSFRALKYETSAANASSGISDPTGVGRIISQGLRFRNVFLYDLGVYDWGSRNAPQGRNTWGGSIAQGDPVNGADQTLTSAQGRALEDAAIKTWNQIQIDLQAKGFFAAWGFQPQDVPANLDRSTYEANPSAYVPSDTSKVFAYGATAPSGFTVTADTISKGYEFELTANPTKNWRIAFNASQTEATRTNVGGAVLEEYIAYMDEKLGYGTSGTPAGRLPQFGNTSLSILNNVWNTWRGNYTLLKLQEGTAASELRKWRYNVITNYTFSEGRLKGFGVGGSYRWQDKVVLGYPVVPGTPVTFDLTKPYYGPAETNVDLWCSYERKLSQKLNWKIQLNVRNAFANDELIPISIQPDGKTWASVRTSPAREWFVTNTFSF